MEPFQKKSYLQYFRIILINFFILFNLSHSSPYKTKLRDITSLSQFEKVILKKKNEKHSVLKEEEHVTSALKQMVKDNKIREELFDRLKPSGSQAPRLYGLAKVHKDSMLVSPVVSMPGSAYHRIANQISDWLKVVTECNTLRQNRLLKPYQK